MRHSPNQGDRIAGCLVGMACGDALGAGYEFQDHVTEDPCMRGGGLGWGPGEWTDDTQMAVAIARVAYRGSLDEAEVGESFLRWLRASPNDVGIQTKAVLSAAKGGGDLRNVAEQFLKRKPNAAGNGSLMRTAPVALAFLDDEATLFRKATAVSALTHAHQEAQEACALWCIAIQRAVTQRRLEDAVYDGLRYLESDRREFWTSILREAEAASPEELRPNGYVVKALQAAHHAIVATPVPEEVPGRHLVDALKAAVRIGNDTDTVAAIAGSLLGAYWGYSAIPIAWLRILNGWEPGGGTQRVRDLVRLAHQAAAGPQGKDKWPVCSSMFEHPDYLEGRHLLEPLRDDERLWVGNINALKARNLDVDVVVSLCRVGCDDVPEGLEGVEVFMVDQEAANANLEWTLLDIASTLARWTEKGERVLIHCVGGRSRTPTVAAAYLAHSKGMSGPDALRRVREQLPEHWRNRSFEAALQKVWPRSGVHPDYPPTECEPS